MERKNENEVVVKLSPEERNVVLDVLAVEQQGLDLAENKNKDAQKYGRLIEILQGKFQAA